jgi:tRNA A37 threonylcarbamoyladenosine synthetase subunit TsaC/SUA5/YrdC
MTTFDCSDSTQRATGIASAISALKGGRLVVMPTDTVYGIGADAFDRDAVGSLLAAKGRGRDMPVGVLVGSWTTIDGLVFSVPDAAEPGGAPGAVAAMGPRRRQRQRDAADAASPRGHRTAA